MKIKYDETVMKTVALFESLTGARVKDAVIGEYALFIVYENEMGKAIGKKGSNVRRIEYLLKKKVKVVEFSSDAVQFVRNMIEPLKAADIKEENSAIVIYGPDVRTKGLLIGRDRKNINHLADVVKRYFSIAEIKVV